MGKFIKEKDKVEYIENNCFKPISYLTKEDWRKLADKNVFDESLPENGTYTQIASIEKYKLTVF